MQLNQDLWAYNQVCMHIPMFSFYSFPSMGKMCSVNLNGKGKAVYISKQNQFLGNGFQMHFFTPAYTFSKTSLGK